MPLEPPPKLIRSPLWPGVAAFGPLCAVEGVDLVLDESYRQPRDGQMAMMVEHIFESPRRIAEYTARMQHELQQLGALGDVSRYGQMDLATQRAVDHVIAIDDQDAEALRQWTGDRVPPLLGAPVTWEHLIASRNDRDRARVAACFGEVDLRFWARARKPHEQAPHPPHTQVGAVAESDDPAIPPGHSSEDRLLAIIGRMAVEQMLAHLGSTHMHVLPPRIAHLMQQALASLGLLHGPFMDSQVDTTTLAAMNQWLLRPFARRYFSLGPVSPTAARSGPWALPIMAEAAILGWSPPDMRAVELGPLNAAQQQYLTP